MLQTLERNAATLGLADRVETVATDAEHLPFDDESFDLVLGHAVLHHLPDLDQAFREFRRVLRARRCRLLRRRAVGDGRSHRGVPEARRRPRRAAVAPR